MLKKVVFGFVVIASLLEIGCSSPKKNNVESEPYATGDSVEMMTEDTTSTTIAEAQPVEKPLKKTTKRKRSKKTKKKVTNKG
jgi:uncharacterized protein YcfL